MNTKIPITAVSSATASAGTVPIPTIVTSASAVVRRPGIEEVEVQTLTDLEAAALGHPGVDDRLVGCVGVWEATGAQRRTLDGEAIVDRREQRGRQNGVDAVRVAEEAGVDPLPGDAVDGAQRPFRLLGWLPERDRRVGGVGRDEDAVVRRRGGRGRREAREAEPKPEAEQHAGGDQRAPMAGQASLGDEPDDPHQQAITIIGVPASRRNATGTGMSDRSRGLLPRRRRVLRVRSSASTH